MSEGESMLDVAYALTVVAFFAVGWMAVKLCDRL